MKKTDTEASYTDCGVQDQKNQKSNFNCLETFCHPIWLFGQGTFIANWLSFQTKYSGGELQV